jgi:NADPH:quinone reductase-like Zn-dependent oxidoreductase
MIENFSGPDPLIIKEVPHPDPSHGYAVIRVNAFGVSGTECVGTVAACPGGEFAEGNPVATVMGGLGRTVSGSYAQFTRVQVSNVIALGPAALKLPWDALGAIPEWYATAWTCLFRNLELAKGQMLLIRGGSSAFGRAAINLAVHAGAHLIATTRNVTAPLD